MAQKMPRNELLHERRHKRKAGAHEDHRGSRPTAKEELRRALADALLNLDCPRARMRAIKALNCAEEDR